MKHNICETINYLSRSLWLFTQLDEDYNHTSHKKKIHGVTYETGVKEFYSVGNNVLLSCKIIHFF